MALSYAFVVPLPATRNQHSSFTQPLSTRSNTQQTSARRLGRLVVSARAGDGQRGKAPDGVPDFNSGFDPSNDPEYTEVRAYSFTTCRNNCSLLTLVPITGGPLAFKMSVTSLQADAIRKSIVMGKGGRNSKDRPSTHDLMSDIVQASGTIISKAAITHMMGDVFIARLWLKQIDHPNSTFEIDCRPSDALILTSKNKAPLYLNWKLLRQWGVSMKNIEFEHKNGKCDIIEYANSKKSTRSLQFDIMYQRKDILDLAVLKSRLDLAVQLQRFKEAAEIQNEINAICPIDQVKKDLNLAVKEERFRDAAVLMDELCKWKGKLRLWEKGEIDLQKDYYDKLLGRNSSTGDENKPKDNNDNNNNTGNHNTFRGLGI